MINIDNLNNTWYNVDTNLAVYLFKGESLISKCNKCFYNLITEEYRETDNKTAFTHPKSIRFIRQANEKEINLLNHI